MARVPALLEPEQGADPAEHRIERLGGGEVQVGAEPNVIRPAGVSACTPLTGGSAGQVEHDWWSSRTRWPCRHLTVALRGVPVAELSSAPGTVTGRYSVDPATSSLQSMLPPR